MTEKPLTITKLRVISLKGKLLKVLRRLERRSASYSMTECRFGTSATVVLTDGSADAVLEHDPYLPRHVAVRRRHSKLADFAKHLVQGPRGVRHFLQCDSLFSKDHFLDVVHLVGTVAAFEPRGHALQLRLVS